jgi:hypothetical protein
MRPRHSGIFLFLLGALLFAPTLIRAQEQDVVFHPGLKMGFHVEVLSRTLVWDEGVRSSRIIAPLAAFSVAYRIRPGLSLGVLAGYSLPDWNGLVFRGLPFSIDYEAGSIGGFLLGAEIEASLFKTGYWELTASAQFSASLGRTITLPIGGLAVAGELDAQGTWMRIQAGPALTYRGLELFSPFFSLSFDHFWGRFNMTETVEDLIGTERKTVSGAGNIAASFGTYFEPSPLFSLKIAGTLIPFKKIGSGGLGLDFGGSLRAVLSF